MRKLTCPHCNRKLDVPEEAPKGSIGVCPCGGSSTLDEKDGEAYLRGTTQEEEQLRIENLLTKLVNGCGNPNCKIHGKGSPQNLPGTPKTCKDNTPGNLDVKITHIVLQPGEDIEAGLKRAFDQMTKEEQGQKPTKKRRGPKPHNQVPPTFN